MNKTKKIKSPSKKLTLKPELPDLRLKEAENKEIYNRLVEWLYLNDGEFKNKYEWREEFLFKLKQLLDLKEDEPHAVIFNDPF